MLHFLHQFETRVARLIAEEGVAAIMAILLALLVTVALKEMTTG
ncbi:hypothetical protein [Tardiphaga sp.]